MKRTISFSIFLFYFIFLNSVNADNASKRYVNRVQSNLNLLVPQMQNLEKMRDDVRGFIETRDSLRPLFSDMASASIRSGGGVPKNLQQMSKSFESRYAASRSPQKWNPIIANCRKINLKLRSINPVPRKLKTVDDNLMQFSVRFDSALDAFKAMTYGGGDESVELAENRYADCLIYLNKAMDEISKGKTTNYKGKKYIN